MLTQTRRKVFPLDVKPEDIDLIDIASSLGKQCRYNGHVDRFYSVAEHCVIISRALERDGYPPIVQKQGLFHDAQEEIVSDLIKPLKNALLEKGIEWHDFEHPIERIVAQKFGLPWPYDKAVGVYDKHIVRDEKNQLKYDLTDDWSTFGIPPDGLGVQIEGLEWREATTAFLKRYEELYG